jgi:hypothetical protein
MGFFKSFRHGTVAMSAIAFGALALEAFATDTNPWTDLNDVGNHNEAGNEPRALHLDRDALHLQLAQAQGASRGVAAVFVDLPRADGSFRRFAMFDSEVMPQTLAARFPMIHSYTGYAVDAPQVRAALDESPAGFSAMIATEDGVEMITPDGDTNAQRYLNYHREALSGSSDFRCLTDGSHARTKPRQMSLLGTPSPATVTGSNLRTYRVAVAATGEYTAKFGGTVVGGQAEIVRAINRVNSIYMVDLGVKLQLVANNSSLVYTNALGDPYTNDDADALLTENQTNLDNVIGGANYDLGHVFSTGGGGLASLAVPCDSTYKAQGETGSSNPTGDDFWVDYVAHEMGHQMGADHSFNGTSGFCDGNRAPNEAYEPGSGSTIMGYAGICDADDLQPHSDPIFHAGSIVPIAANLANTGAGGGGSCGTASTNGNHVPVPNAGADYTIPKNTPFQLTGSATDADSDAFTYIWEEMDLGAQAPPEGDNGDRPIFRSFTPSTLPIRILPRMPSVLSGTLVHGESWPTTTRDLKFRLTVRDNHANGGATASDDMVVHVNSTAGPFAVTAPAAAASWSGGGSAAVTWNVGNTSAAPVSCANVKIELSTDSGTTFATVLKASTANSGSAAVTAPNVASTQARVKVSCVGNIFFNVSPGNFSIVPVNDRIFANGFES